MFAVTKPSFLNLSIASFTEDRRLAISSSNGAAFFKRTPLSLIHSTGISKLPTEDGTGKTSPKTLLDVFVGVRTESVPLGEIKKLTEDRLLLFDEQIISYAMGNSMVIEDTNGNRKLVKRRYEHKIDPVSALMDAYVAYNRNIEMFR